jgi:exonuclease SbcC
MAHAGMEWDASFEAMQKADKAWMDEADRVVRTAEALEKECGRLRNLVEKAGDAHAGAERDTQAARFGNDAAIMLLDRQKNELETIRIRIEDSLSVLGNDLADYGFETVATQDMGRIQEQLSARRGRWISRQEEKQVLIRKTAELGIRVSHQAEQILKADDEVRKQRNLQCELQGFQDALVRERGELLGDENPDDVELVLSKGIEGAGAALEEIRLEHGASLLELDTLKARMDALSKSLLARGVRMNAAEDAFRGRLSHSDFADEERFIAACLPEEKRKSLMETAKALSDENAGLSSKLADTEKRRESEHMKNMTDMPRSELIQAEADLAESRKILQQEIGAMRQKLTDNAVVKDRLRERASAIDAQKRECSRWELLHGLIGSADGKKYRNFAQGLTFDIMISHANLQLRNLSDRYLLVRDPAQPLELCVIDNYQAGETRSTKNLSGGESFIVSLSLALGLSRMASRKVRVDSLFLDEGFGTLDEEALGTALETLAGLRQDGKLIGVISHVSALKERIGTQIRVMPQSGGNSILSGPGCARGKNAGKAGKDLEE